MAKLPSIKELLNMKTEDLLRESKEASEELAKMRLNVRNKKQKDTAEYQRLKKHVARIKTIHAQKTAAKTAVSPSTSTDEN